MTWNEVVQVGGEAAYGLVVSRPAATDRGAELLAIQGFSLALGVGMRVH